MKSKGPSQVKEQTARREFLKQVGKGVAVTGPAIALLLAASAIGLGGAAGTLALWSGWEARRTLGLPRSVTPVAVIPLGRPRGLPAAPAPVPPLGNLVHLDRYGHQPFRAHAWR